LRGRWDRNRYAPVCISRCLQHGGKSTSANTCLRN
jgi:hypothetical protein